MFGFQFFRVNVLLHCRIAFLFTISPSYCPEVVLQYFWTMRSAEVEATEKLLLLSKPLAFFYLLLEGFLLLNILNVLLFLDRRLSMCNCFEENDMLQHSLESCLLCNGLSNGIGICLIYEKFQLKCKKYHPEKVLLLKKLAIQIKVYYFDFFYILCLYCNTLSVSGRERENLSRAYYLICRFHPFRCRWNLLL